MGVVVVGVVVVVVVVVVVGGGVGARATIPSHESDRYRQSLF